MFVKNKEAKLPRNSASFLTIRARQLDSHLTDVCVSRDRPRWQPSNTEGSSCVLFSKRTKGVCIVAIIFIEFFCGISKSPLLTCVMLFNKLTILSIKASSWLIRETFILY